jgi:hypothetical protein
MLASSANDNRAAAATSGRRAAGVGPQVDARGEEIARLHQALTDWRDRRRLADAEGWPALAARVVDIEIRALEREIARHVRELF